MNLKNSRVQKLAPAAMFLALGLVLPFVMGQIPYIGNMLLPMHLPVLLCGLICGWRYGLVVGFMTPIMRAILIGAPTLYPRGVRMALELATYGLIVGLIYGLAKKKSILSVYGAMIPAMLAGRIVWGLISVLQLGAKAEAFTLQAFVAGGFVEAIPGILLQLILIPAVMAVWQKKIS